MQSHFQHTLLSGLLSKERYALCFLNFLGKSKLLKLPKTEQNYLTYTKLAVRIVRHNHSFDCFVTV